MYGHNGINIYAGSVRVTGCDFGSSHTPGPLRLWRKLTSSRLRHALAVAGSVLVTSKSSQGHAKLNPAGILVTAERYSSVTFCYIKLY